MSSLRSVSDSEEVWKEDMWYNLPWKDHCESYEHWNSFKGDVGETSVKQDGVHMGFSTRTDTILNWTGVSILKACQADFQYQTRPWKHIKQTSREVNVASCAGEKAYPDLWRVWTKKKCVNLILGALNSPTCAGDQAYLDLWEPSKNAKQISVSNETTKACRGDSECSKLTQAVQATKITLICEKQEPSEQVKQISDQTVFVQKKKRSKFTHFSQLQKPGMMPKYGTEKRHEGTQIFCTLVKGCNPYCRFWEQ